MERNAKLGDTKEIWIRNARTTNTSISDIKQIREFSLELDSSSSNVLTEEGTELQYSSLFLIEYIIKLDLLVNTSVLIKPFDKHNCKLMGSFASPRAYASLLIGWVA